MQNGAPQDENFEDKIEQAMAKIVSDTLGQETPAPQNPEAECQSVKKPEKTVQKSPERKNATPIKGAKPMPYGQPPKGARKIKKVKKGQPVKKAQTRQVQATKGKPAVSPKAQSQNARNARTVPVQPVETPRRKHKALKAAGIVAAMLVVAAGCAYSAATYYYTDKFFEGTKINGIDCSGMTIAQAEKQLEKKVENYSLEVVSRGMEPQAIKGEDIGYEYLPDGSVGAALKRQNPFLWAEGFFGGKEVKAATQISYSKEKLETQMNSLDCARPENQEAPENAYVAFKDTQFEIVPETQGSTLDSRKAFKLLKNAVSESKEQVNFDEEDVYIPAAVRKDDPGLAATLADCNAYTKASITYTFGDRTEVLDAATIKDWLTFDEKGQFVQNDAVFSQHVTEYVTQLAGRWDTIGKERNFHTTSGRDIVVSGGNYGWQIDQAGEAAQLAEEIRTGQVVTREPAYTERGMVYGESDIGNTYVEVDLSGQNMWYYKDGTVIFESPFVSGNMSYSDRATPGGVCHLYYKQRDQVLRGKKKPDGTYEYESPVAYWMPFNGGVGFHDANWRGSFGGSIYLTSGSHGCINMPPYKAAEFYELITTEVPIVAFY